MIYKHGNVVLLGEPFRQFSSVLEYPSHQIIGHSNIHGPHAVSDDVDVVFIHAGLVPPDFRFLFRGVYPEPSRRAPSE